MNNSNKKNPTGFQQHAFSDTPLMLKVLIGVLLLALASRLSVAFQYEINWDEFNFLAIVHQYINNKLASNLQTFHIYFFTWVSWVSDNEVNQIVSARSVMVLLQLATGFFIFAITRKFTSVNAALFAVISYFSVSYIIRTGGSFRYDPIATFCLMGSLYLILARTSSLKNSIAAGILIAVSQLVTMKSALYFPTIGIVVVSMWVNSSFSKQNLLRLFALCLSFVITFFLLYAVHKSNINMPESASATTTMSNTMNKAINHNNLFPRWSTLALSFIIDIAYWITLFSGLWISLAAYRKSIRFSRIEVIIIASMILPFISVFFYRNAFPYYYAFMLAPASILCGVTWDALPWRKNAKKSNRIAIMVLFLMSTSIIYHGFVAPFNKNLDRQHKLLEVVHRTFPDPTPYFDRCSMVSSYPQVGFLMSTWVLENYKNRGVPQLMESIEKNKPPFFIANIGPLDFKEKTPILPNAKYTILDDDKKAIVENYIHHWGEIYVAGRQIKLTNSNPESRFPISISGEYTLEGPSAVFIDGVKVAPGDSLFLSDDSHIMNMDQSTGDFTLRWGKQLYRPQSPPNETAIFNGF